MESAKVLRLPQYFRNIQRLSEIARVLISHGFGDLVTRMRLPSYLSGLSRVFSTVLPESSPRRLKTAALKPSTRLRMVCEELGPTFIKFGQIIATRPDIFPEHITSEFCKLQDEVQPFPMAEAIERIEQELGKPLHQIFSAIDEVPIGAASIAQVHKATLLDGTEVVVKVQRPHLDRIIDTDTDILLGLATLVEEHIPESHQYGPFRLVEEFVRSLRQEIDFIREARNMRQFAMNAHEEPLVTIPQVYSQYSSRRILTQEFIPGTRVDVVATSGTEKTLGRNNSGKQLLEALNGVILRSIFETGFFHGDPHPGNVLLTTSGTIALIDFGSMGRLDQARQIQVVQFLLAIFSRNLDRVVRVLQDNLVTPLALDEISLKNQLAEVIDSHFVQSFGPLNLTTAVSDIFEVARRHGIRPPPDLLLIGRVLTSLQIVAAALDPSFDPAGMVAPYLKQRYKEILTSPKLYRDFTADLSYSYRTLLQDLPRDLRTTMRRIARGEFSIGHTIENLPQLAAHHNHLVNRVIMTIIGVTLVVTSKDAWNGDSLSFVLLTIGALILLRVWLAVRGSGGM